jgi:hypothetical protein
LLEYPGVFHFSPVTTIQRFADGRKPMLPVIARLLFEPPRRPSSAQALPMGYAAAPAMQAPRR